MPIPPLDPAAPKSLPLRVLEPLFLSKAGKWTLMNVSRRVDPTILRLTRGRFSTVMVLPAVLLTVKGAKSGIERTIPLLYFTDGDRVVLMASNFGGAKHPGWYHNVKANPEVTLYGGGYGGRFIAEEAVGAERDRLFERAKAMTEGYARYETTTGGRTIPVVVFTPV
jgi:deazaflavin-dependent oxidoreductase (nitroreductase family)